MKNAPIIGKVAVLTLAFWSVVNVVLKKQVVSISPTSLSPVETEHQKVNSSLNLPACEVNSSLNLSACEVNSSLDLPACDELMSRPNSSFADGDFITRSSTPHDWVVQPDGSRQFELRSICQLKRYTAEEARQCLAGKHISMIGDSLTRYQYLSLVYFIHKGVWPPAFGMESPCRHFDAQNVSTCSTSPHICLIDDFKKVKDKHKGWILYHEVIGGADDGGIFDGHLECQCRKDTGHSDVNIRYDGPPQSASSFQNITITHFMESGREKPDPISGWNFTGCSATGTCRYTKEHAEDMMKKQKYDWSQNITTILDPMKGMLPQQFPKVDFALYNRGIWGGLPKDRAQIILPFLRDWVRPSNGRCFYKATTSGLRKTPLTTFDFEVSKIAYKEGCSFIDYGHVSHGFGALKENDPARRDVYMDSSHFIPWVYAEFNNILLNVLCNSRSNMSN